MEVTAYRLAERFVGLAEVAGATSNPQVLAMLRLDAGWVESDETPWCSAFVNYVAWLLRLPRSGSLAARSWLKIGIPVPISEAVAGSDVVVLKRPGGPGADVVAAPGHVGFYAGAEDDDSFWLLGGNQGDKVSVALFDLDRVLGVRRLEGVR